MGLPLTSPSPDHLEFDLLCEGLEDFEPLPSVTVASAPAPANRGPEEETSLDGQIMAGLVSPV